MVLFTLTFAAWAVVHSLTASRRLKEWSRRRFGARATDGLYRLAYNLFSALTLVPVLAVLATAVPPRVWWQIPPPLSWAARLLQLAGLAGLLISLWQTDVWEFAGLRQALNYLARQQSLVPPPRLVTGGAYALVRHPLYFFSLLMLWPNPIMDTRIFLFNLLATLYFWAGSRMEEKRLAATFGAAYREYRAQVPGLIPLPRPRSR